MCYSAPTVFLPTVEAQTACFLLPEQGILLDAGSGLYRLADHWPGPALDIYLSHGHGDHISGLHYLFGALFTAQCAHADAPLTEKTFPTLVVRANALLDAVCIHATPATLAELQGRFPYHRDGRPLQGQGPLRGCVTLTPFILNPSREEVGFRLDWPGHSLAYVTDTIAHPNAPYVKEIAGVDLLLHECNGPDHLAGLMSQIYHSPVGGSISSENARDYFEFTQGRIDDDVETQS
ncbi:MAG: hypothetical protein GVY30_10215 [Chloroflexi bacterium]|nr:hypothetical protein [Chloroflexota bacterium]